MTPSVSAPSTSAASQNVMEEQQPARKIVLTQPPETEKLLSSYPSDPAQGVQIDDRMCEYFAINPVKII